MCSVREREREYRRGILFSDSLKELRREPKLAQRPAGPSRPFADRDPVRLAEALYLLKNGVNAFNELMERLFDEVFSL